MEGRYELLVKHLDEFRGRRVGGYMGRDLMVAEKGERGVTWEFLQVG